MNQGSQTNTQGRLDLALLQVAAHLGRVIGERLNAPNLYDTVARAHVERFVEDNIPARNVFEPAPRPKRRQR